MTEVQSNFAALAAGEPGAPPLDVNSLMWSGVASGAFLNVSSGLQTTGVGSFGAVHVSSGYQTTGVGSFGALDVSSGVVLATAPSTPPANEAFRESIAKAWINFDGTGTIAIRDSFNVASITDDGTGTYTVTWDTDFANANYAAGVAAGVGTSVNVAHINSTAVGSMVIRTIKSTFGLDDSDLVSAVVFGDQ